MKKFVSLLCVICCLFCGTVVFAEGNIEGWVVDEFVDEFGDPIGEKLIKASITGSFSNIATTDSVLSGYVFFDLDTIFIRLFEYGKSKTVFFTDKAVMKYKVDGTIYTSDIYANKNSNEFELHNVLSHNSFTQIIGFLKQGIDVRCVITIDSSKYSFTMHAGNFADGYLSLCQERYASAEYDLQSGNYITAENAFLSIADYEDSAQRARDIPKAIIMSENWKKTEGLKRLATGGLFSVGVKADGTIITAGDLQYVNDADELNTWKDIVSVYAANTFIVGLKADGTVMMVGGSNKYDSVRLWSGIVAISVANGSVIGLRYDGTVVAAGYNWYGECNVGNWRDIVAISSGTDHTVGLKSNGNVVAVGSAHRGRDGVSEWKNIIAISAGNMYTLGLKADGSVVAVGNNDDNRSTVNGWNDIVSISACSSSFGIKENGTVIATGYNKNGQRDVDSWTDIVAVFTNGFHTLGLRADGTVVATGINDNRQCDVSSWSNMMPS